MRRILLHGSLLLFCSFAVPTALHAQDSGISAAKQEKLLAKKERRDVKEVKKEEKRLAKKHLENQGKATRKRMKRNKRRADKHGSSAHRDPWPGRWFTK